VTQANRMLCDALIDLLGAALADELALDTRPGAGLLPAFALPVDVAADRP